MCTKLMPAESGLPTAERIHVGENTVEISAVDVVDNLGHQSSRKDQVSHLDSHSPLLQERVLFTLATAPGDFFSFFKMGTTA